MSSLYKSLLLVVLVSVCFFCSCDGGGEDPEIGGISSEVAGEYVGEYQSNSVSSINPYSILVSQISEIRVAIKPKEGEDFDEFQIDLASVNDTTISSSPDASVVTFSMGATDGMGLLLDPLGAGHIFLGAKQ